MALCIFWYICILGVFGKTQFCREIAIGFQYINVLYPEYGFVFLVSRVSQILALGCVLL